MSHRSRWLHSLVSQLAPAALCGLAVYPAASRSPY